MRKIVSVGSDMINIFLTHSLGIFSLFVEWFVPIHRSTVDKWALVETGLCPSINYPSIDGHWWQEMISEYNLDEIYILNSWCPSVDVNR